MARPSSTTSSATPTWWSTSWAGTGSAYRWSSRPGRRARSPSPDDDGKVDGRSGDFCQHGAVARILAAEQTMALLLAQARNVPQAHAALKAGKWERSRWEGVELHGKVLGVVGLGRVGALVAQRALAFGMRLAAYDPFVSVERAKQMGVELMGLDELVRVADFLTVRLPKTL